MPASLFWPAGERRIPGEQGSWPLKPRRLKEGAIRLPKKIKDVVSILREKHARDIVVLNLSKSAGFTDYFIICTGGSLPQSKAIAEAVAERKSKGRYGKEGFPDNSWILLDHGDFILHIFLPEAREFYALERIWADAPKQNMDEAEEKRK